MMLLSPVMIRLADVYDTLNIFLTKYSGACELSVKTVLNSEREVSLYKQMLQLPSNQTTCIVAPVFKTT